MAPVQLQGPKSREVMAGLFGEKMLEITRHVRTSAAGTRDGRRGTRLWLL